MRMNVWWRSPGCASSTRSVLRLSTCPNQPISPAGSPWSPGPAPGSATASPPRWPAPARRSWPRHGGRTGWRSWPRRSAPPAGSASRWPSTSPTPPRSPTSSPGRATSLGTVDILVNNAGIPDAQRAHKMPLELVDAVLDTNVRGPWLLSTEVAKRLIAAESPGRIVNIASMAAFSYNGMAAALYSVSKTAIHRMTEVLAVEWATLPHQRQLHRPRRLRLGDDGRHALPDGRLHRPVPAQAPGPARAARLDAALPRVTRRPRSSPARRSRSTTARAGADGFPVRSAGTPVPADQEERHDQGRRGRPRRQAGGP